MRQAFINGEFCDLADAKISIFDRGFLFGDAIYEVLPVYNSRPFFVEKHLNRLYSNLEKVNIEKPLWDLNTLITQLIEKNGGGDLQVYIHITRGNQGFRKHDIPKDLPSSLIAFTIHNNYPTLMEKQSGLKAKIVEDIRWSRCDIKTTSLLANILLNDNAVVDGYHTSILSRNNIITEGSAANVFMVDAKGVIKTPPLNNSCLPGITRDITIEIIKQLKLPYLEIEFTVNELLNAQEAWITSTTKEIFPVIQINEHIINGGKIGTYCLRINDYYKKLVAHD
ncbi:aminotransferase class IV [Legionella sp. km772]|uniref:aminotransferase class IV n=1 Tax=Legionella sp. km772 TaxID=2498111 RepID=UPI000F8F5B5D|nr:aminotransferase class IV [Legionella sp. km772]RUR11987.1 D-amino acid aminotransferase [Legionella sp. km772]